MSHSLFNSRRQFLKRCLVGSVSAAALTHTQLAAMQGLLAAPSSQQAYKALVCVFLYGGNDAYNMLVPIDGQARTDYQAVRQSLAVENPIPLALSEGVDGGIGLNPAMANLAPLIDDGEVAVIGSVGSLLRPTTLSEIDNGTAALPAHLFSHNDQQATWMNGQERVSLNYGWGARMLELVNQQANFASSVSVAGSNQWQNGVTSAPFSLSESGIAELHAFNTSETLANHLRGALTRLQEANNHPLASSYANQLQGAISNTEVMNLALVNAPTLTTQFSDNPLSAQLANVARTISVQQELNPGPQIFFVGMGGFDTHDAQAQVHPGLLNTLATGLSEFNAALKELGVNQDVTTFTMSDFGRTLTSNGDGTDHGWASNQLVMGGAVNGNALYGHWQAQRLGTSNDVGGGRFIPHIANEQYFATLAQWFGASSSDVLDLFPNLNQFNQTNLGFMRG